MIEILYLILGFAILIKGADMLVAGSTSLAKRLNVSDLVIGLTIVAFGTSTPELVVNIAASLQGSNAIAVGNILGSNIVNILLILGCSSLIYPLYVTLNTVWKEIPLSFLAAVILFILANDQIIDSASVSVLSKGDGLVLLSFFVIFLFYTINMAIESSEKLVSADQTLYSYKKTIIYILLGFILLIFGGKIVVESAVRIATAFGLSESLIGLTIVAIGTSLPEFATSAVAAYRKNANIAVGNIVGSNIFNIFFILGIGAIIKPIPYDVSFNSDTIIMICSSLFLFWFMFTGEKKRLDRWEGALMVVAYFCYIAYSIIR